MILKHRSNPQSFWDLKLSWTLFTGTLNLCQTSFLLGRRDLFSSTQVTNSMESIHFKKKKSGQISAKKSEKPPKTSKIKQKGPQIAHFDRILA